MMQGTAMPAEALVLRVILLAYLWLNLCLQAVVKLPHLLELIVLILPVKQLHPECNSFSRLPVLPPPRLAEHPLLLLEALIELELHLIVLRTGGDLHSRAEYLGNNELHINWTVLQLLQLLPRAELPLPELRVVMANPEL